MSAVVLGCKARGTRSDVEELAVTQIGNGAFTSPDFLETRQPVLVFYWNQTNLNTFDPIKDAETPRPDVRFTESTKNYLHLIKALKFSGFRARASEEDRRLLNELGSLMALEASSFAPTGRGRYVGQELDARLGYNSMFTHWVSAVSNAQSLRQRPVAIFFLNLPPKDGVPQLGYTYTQGDGRLASVQEVPVPGPLAGTYPFNEHPLATAEGFEAALDIVTRRYPEDRSRYLLIIKSHGDQDSPLALKLPVELRRTPVDDLARSVVARYAPERLKVRAAFKARTDEWSTDDPIYASLPSIGAGKPDAIGGKDVNDPTGGKDVNDPTGGKDVNDPTGGKDVNDPTGGKGVMDPLSPEDGAGAHSDYFANRVSKVEVIQRLQRRRTAAFPIVVFESCNSTLGLDQARRIKDAPSSSNVGTVYGSVGGLAYEDNLGANEVRDEPGGDFQLQLQSRLNGQVGKP
jgi:hypothetical protein